MDGGVDGIGFFVALAFAQQGVGGVLWRGQRVGLLVQVDQALLHLRQLEPGLREVLLDAQRIVDAAAFVQEDQANGIIG